MPSVFSRVKNRITEPIVKSRIQKKSIVSISDWISALESYLTFFEKSGKIPSPWGFLNAPHPWNAMPQIRDIYLEQHYKCSFDTPPSRIVDCGGNIGLGTLYFASTYPTAKIEVYEADPKLATTIQENCEVAKISHKVTVIAKAVTDHNNTARFNITGNDSGCISEDGDEVPCIDIASIISEPVDLLKIDIEGGEFTCFERLASTGKLGIPSRIISEVHLGNDDAERINVIIHNLVNFGFKVALRSDLGTWTGSAAHESPFHLIHKNKMFLHLYAWK